MAVNLLSMDVIVLACAVFRGVAPLPRARAEGVLCVVCASRGPSGAARRVRRARRAAGAARAALGSSRVQRRSGRVRLARCAGPCIAQALNSVQQRRCFCATVWRRAAKLFSQQSSAHCWRAPGTPQAHRSGILALRRPIFCAAPAFCTREISARPKRSQAALKLLPDWCSGVQNWFLDACAV